MAALLTLGLLLTWVTPALGAAVSPRMTLDNGTFLGISGSANTHSYLGIPFAKPPVGPLRFNLPAPVDAYHGDFNATSMGFSCPQQYVRVPILTGIADQLVSTLWSKYYSGKYPDDEDCLTINIIKPANATSDSNLPVVFWLFAGAFEFGTPARYDGTPVVERSIEMGQPIIYVSINYRLSAFGFLASKEVRAAGVGNLGLQDQREALRWVQKYISQFGGDPTKVTIWGESAGAISVSLQMLTNGGDTEGLFRAAYMQSGSPVPVGPVENGQKYYDAIVQQTGCGSSNDTLDCLRGVPYATLKSVVDASPFFLDYSALVLAWVPREDGNFLKDHPQKLVQQGSVANVPLVSGDCDDEGTIFSLSTLNITTDDQFASWLATEWAPTSGPDVVQALTAAYPSDVSFGSPYGTGSLNALTPQYKRIAAFQGDAVFHAPRRFFLQSQSGKQPMWSYLNKRDKIIPVLGSFHTSDVSNVFGKGELTDYLVNFVTNLDPNGPTVPQWPQYSTAQPNLLTLNDIGSGLFAPKIEITQDTFRNESIAVMTQISLEHPI